MGLESLIPNIWLQTLEHFLPAFIDILVFHSDFFLEEIMPAVSLRLPDEVFNRLEDLAKLTGRSKTFYMIKAITDHIDDLEDLFLAEQRLINARAGKSKTHTLDEVERNLAWLIKIDDEAQKDLAKLLSDIWNLNMQYSVTCETWANIH